MEAKDFELGYVLYVDGPTLTVHGDYVYKDKKTGELRTGWYHCGCCGQDGLMSINTPTCTGCANKLQFGRMSDSPVSIEHIREYCKWVDGLPR